ncbi:MAG: hypothetical protein GX541_02095 [Clostridiales bacterium]|jgi:ATP-dependent helicase/nuclease subunit B|nr:hypothetical protein [Clostridiales bacterium]
MLTLVLGRAGTGKTTRVIGEIAEIARKSDKPVCLIVPEQFSHTTERQLCETGDAISRTAEVLSFRRLCGRVAAVCGGGARKTLSRGERILLLYKALRRTGPSLKTLCDVSTEPEFITGLLSLIDELKSYNITHEELLDIAKDTHGLLGDKLNDIALIYAAYRSSFGRGEIDSNDELDLLYENIVRCGFFKGKTVYLDGFSGFTGQEYKIIAEIIRTAENVTITLCHDPDADSMEKQIFSKTSETMARLIEIANRHNLKYSVIRLAGNRRSGTEALKHIEKYAFAANIAGFNGNPDGIVICEASDSFEECELAAGYILRLVRDFGFRYRDICVTARNFDEYAADIEAVFERYGIPVYLNRRAQVEDKPVIALILNALTCIKDGFKYESMLGYLKTGLTGIRRPSLDMLENYLYTWQIRGSMWTRDKGFTMNPDGEEGPPEGDAVSRLTHLNTLRERIRGPLLKLRAELRADRTGKGVATALYNFLNEINLARKLYALSRLYTIRNMPDRAAEYRALWDILCNIIEAVGLALKDDEIEAEELISLIRILAAQYDIGMIPVALDRVNASEFTRIGEAGMRALLVLGASDGAMPGFAKSGGILTDSERDILNEMGMRLNPGVRARIDEEMRLIYNAFSAPSEVLYVSYPRAELKGEKKSKSIAVLRLGMIFGGAESFDIISARTQAKVPCFDMLASRGNPAKRLFEDDAHYGRLLKLCERNSKIPRGPISDKENIDALFGKRIRLSASRADKFYSCRYAYFLKYGINAKPRSRKALDAPEIGTFIHFVLEETMRGIIASGGVEKVSRKQASEISEASVLRFVETVLNGFEDKSPRFIYLFKRLERILENVVGNLYDELCDSKFIPLDFELGFSDKKGSLPSLRVKDKDFELEITGYVDRVDGYEKDGVLYLRVIDYKTGNKRFSLDEVLNGIGIQMLLYLFALKTHGESRYKKPVVPAGVLYVPASDGIIDYAPDRGEEKEKSERDKLMRRKGVLIDDYEILCAMDKNLINGSSRYLPVKINKDGDFHSKAGVLDAKGFDRLNRRINELVREIGLELTRGNIEANPYYHFNTSACDYCDYKGACHFDEISGSDRKRPLIRLKFSDFKGGVE